jgi:hypothetical protein
VLQPTWAVTRIYLLDFFFVAKLHVLSLFLSIFQILALASLAMALLPFGYQKSVAGPREGITTTLGFQARLSL